MRIRKQKTLTRALNFFKNKIIGYFECYDGMTGILKILWAGPSREPNPVPLSCQSDRYNKQAILKQKFVQKSEYRVDFFRSADKSPKDSSSENLRFLLRCSRFKYRLQCGLFWKSFQSKRERRFTHIFLIT